MTSGPDPGLLRLFILCIVLSQDLTYGRCSVDIYSISEMLWDLSRLIHLLLGLLRQSPNWEQLGLLPQIHRPT